MKSTSLGALLLFVLVICGLTFLSFPQEKTWIEMNLDNQKLQRAEELLWKRYARDPKDLATAAKLADTLAALGHTHRAKGVAQEVLQRYPENVAWKRRLAFILLAENDPFSAADVLPPTERTRRFWLLLAEEYHKIAQDALAEEALLSGYKDASATAEPWITLATWRAERNDVEGEKEALERALHAAPDNMELVTRYFHNRAKANDLPATLWAADILQKNTPLEREHLEALYALYRSHGNDEAARAILEQLVARADATVADALALVSFLYLQQELERARHILATLSAQAHTLPADVQAAIHSQTQAVQAALLLEAAKRGDEQTVLQALEQMRNLSAPPSPETLRSMMYVCLRLADFFTGVVAENEPLNALPSLPHNAAQGHARADLWLSRAKEIFVQHRAALPLSELENARLAADLAERDADWQAMLTAWNRVTLLDARDAQAWMGIARASQHMEDYETAWQSLRKAEALAGDDAAIRLALALQFQAIAAALPPTYPQRLEKQHYADALARQRLALGWNDELALTLFFRALATDELAEAEKLLHMLGARGRATAHEYLGLAEASLALGADRERVARNARSALSSGPPEIWLRLLYLFTAIDDKKQVSALLHRIETSSLPETAESLRQRADAYGFLGDQARQFALLEKRARLTGLLADWGDAIDRHYWAGDFEGALRLIGGAEKAHPNAPELLARRIVVRVDMQRYAQAVKDFQDAQRQEAGVSEKLHAESLAALAVAYDKTHATGRARHFFKRSLEKDPANHRASLGMASLARREGNIAEAVRYLQAYIARNPTSLWAHFELASLRPHLGKQQYKQVLAQTTPDAQGTVAQANRAVRALALWRTGRLQEAFTVYASIMQEEKKNPNVMCDYAQLLMDMHRYEDARKVLAQTLQSFPDHVWAYRLDATILIREKKYELAAHRLQQALSRAPRDHDALRDLAFVQQVQSKPWAAQKHWLGAGKR